jgi:formylglycine-generating enzyme required for sulfatase activity
VENVSWDDVVNWFVPKLNKLVRGLDMELPTEAQWEYACRAGRQTPFWFGEQITPDQVNYDGNYPYAGGKKGEYRKNTVPVKALPANGWGLYQMHGNLLEWCSDWLEDYPEGDVVDPKGPAERQDNESARRVLRGGCWLDSGGSCRSARRFAYPPDDRGGAFGFRLCRGLAEQPAGLGPPGTGGRRVEPANLLRRPEGTAAVTPEATPQKTRQMAPPPSDEPTGIVEKLLKSIGLGKGRKRQ